MSVGSEDGWLDWANHRAWYRMGHHNSVIGHQVCLLGYLVWWVSGIAPVVKLNLLFPVTFSASFSRGKLEEWKQSYSQFRCSWIKPKVEHTFRMLSLYYTGKSDPMTIVCPWYQMVLQGFYLFLPNLRACSQEPTQFKQKLNSITMHIWELKMNIGSIPDH